jgi:hypothetical protein
MCLQLFGTDEDRENIQKLKEAHYNMVTGYMHKYGLKNRRKAQRQMTKEMESFVRCAARKSVDLSGHAEAIDSLQNKEKGTEGE